MRMRRLGLVPVISADPAVRRYRLARLDEISLATPPNGNGNGHKPAAEVRSIAPPAGIRDRRVS